MSSFSETINVIMSGRMWENHVYGSARGRYREVPVYTTI